MEYQECFEQGEMGEKSNLHNMQIPNSDNPVVSYTLDVILAWVIEGVFLGYKVSQEGIL
jgi:hypothetical protein